MFFHCVFYILEEERLSDDNAITTHTSYVAPYRASLTDSKTQRSDWIPFFEVINCWMRWQRGLRPDLTLTGFEPQMILQGMTAITKPKTLTSCHTGLKTLYQRFSSHWGFSLLLTERQQVNQRVNKRLKESAWPQWRRLLSRSWTLICRYGINERQSTV